MIVIDLDRFKQVNDSVGIAVGDSILLTLARRLGRLLKPQDTLARLSGDQFALILLSERESERIIAFAETLRRALRAPITFNDREIFLTASMGIALGDGQPHRTEEVLKDAELAMYHAKRIGGDRIEVFKPSMRARKTDRLTLESELRRALERDEITILYQPIVRLEDRSVAGFEALARWDHPKMGRMLAVRVHRHRRGDRPDRRSRPVRAGAHRAPARAPGSAASRQRDPVFASVNVSSRQLLRQDLIHDLRTVIARAGPRARHAQAGAHRIAGDGKSRARRADAARASASSAPAWRSTISAPAIPRSPICSASRSTPSRSISRSCAPTARARGR